MQNWEITLGALLFLLALIIKILLMDPDENFRIRSSWFIDNSINNHDNDFTNDSDFEADVDDGDSGD